MNDSTKGFELREATAKDTDAMAQLWLEATSEVAKYEPIYTPNLTGAELAKRLSDELEAGSKRAYVVYANNDLAAYVTFRVESESPVFSPRQYVYVIDLDVSAKFRQQGLSRLLMAEVESYAKGNGIKRIELSVAFADPRAKVVWEHHGFKTHMLLMHKEVL
jgi:GNAT superfamily N-acetyltransferase